MSLETLISQSTIWLFGRKLDDIEIKSYLYTDFEKKGEEQNMPLRGGKNNFLLQQLVKDGERPEPLLARIYAFSYESGFFDMQRPAIFLVHGEGIDPEGPKNRTPGFLGDLRKDPPDLGRTGLGTQTGSFATGIRAWAYDRADFTIRLDLDTGSFESLLLSAELGEGSGISQSAGAHVRSAGAHVRSAGAHVRSAGAHVRSRGPGDSD